MNSDPVINSVCYRTPERNNKPVDQPNALKAPDGTLKSNWCEVRTLPDKYFFYCSLVLKFSDNLRAFDTDSSFRPRPCSTGLNLKRQETEYRTQPHITQRETIRNAGDCSNTRNECYRTRKFDVIITDCFCPK